MRYVSLLAVTVLCFTAGSANADLIPLGGQVGSLETVLSLTSPGASTTESGCVAAGVGGTTLEGVCPGAGPHGLSAFTGGDETAITEVHAAAALGLTDFNNLRIVFNANEPGGNSITIDNLSLTLWDPDTGLIVNAFYIVEPIVLPTTDPGAGDDFFFGLDDTQAATANLLLATFPDLFLGLAANASDATGGPETFSFGVAVPEPTTLALLGLGLAGIGWLSRTRSI